MKLIIQIPCLDEETTLPRTLGDLPRSIAGIDTIEWLIVDDGSRDRTIDVARANGVHHVVAMPKHVGLARAFRAGLDEALRLGADIIVNTDADNQYVGADIASLVGPILAGEADVVVGARDIENHPEFSALKKRLQRLGTRIVCRVAALSVPDVTSGFRAFSRKAALRLNIHSEFSYTLETLIQAGRSRIAVAWVPIRTNRMTRESRLFRSIPAYLRQSGSTIVRIAAMYEPLKTFFYLGAAVASAGLLVGIRFLYYWYFHSHAGHLQSVVLSVALVLLGFQLIVAGLVADLVAANRRLLEELLYRVRQQELDR